MAATKSTSGMSQPDLIDYINNHLGVDFDTLQVQVAARKKDQAISQGKCPHFQPSKHLPSSGSTTAHPGDVRHLMLDDSSVGSSSSTPRQKYISKAANLGPDGVEYDGVTYKIHMAELMTYRTETFLEVFPWGNRFPPLGYFHGEYSPFLLGCCSVCVIGCVLHCLAKNGRQCHVLPSAESVAS
jgi:hypothetical protein